LPPLSTEKKFLATGLLELKRGHSILHHLEKHQPMQKLFSSDAVRSAIRVLALVIMLFVLVNLFS
jgi:hypothetical protein